MPTQTTKNAPNQTLDVERIRRDFPILSLKTAGRPLAYLDNAATSQKPLSVIETLTDYYHRYNANIHRGVHALSVEATQAYEKARGLIRRFLGAGRNEEIIFTKGATEAINLVAQSFGGMKLRPGDAVLVSALEHHSNIVPWQLVCERVGARLKVLPMDPRGVLCLDRLDALLADGVKIVAVAHVSNALGTVNPIRAIADRAHAHGALLLVDGAQAAPHLPILVRELDCDFYAIAGHKMFGPTGVGALYGRRELLEAMPPYQGGGEMIEAVTFEKTTYARIPARFEAGTPPIAQAIGLGAAVEYLESLDRTLVERHEAALLARAEERLEAIPGLTRYGTADDRVGVLTFNLNGVHAHDVGTVLDQMGIAVRTGHHCAQPVMDFFGVPATVRASFAFYNTMEEVDRLAEGLVQAVEIFR